MPPQSDQFAALSNLHSNVPSGTVLVKTNRALGLLVFASGFAVTAVSGGRVPLSPRARCRQRTGLVLVELGLQRGGRRIVLGVAVLEEVPDLVRVADEVVELLEVRLTVGISSVGLDENGRLRAERLPRVAPVV